MAIDANAENPEMQPPAGCRGCAEEGACGAAHPGASLPVADLKSLYLWA